MSTLLFNFRYLIDISNINMMKWKDIKNKVFIGMKANLETNKLVKDNKDINVEVKLLLSELHNCRVNKKALTHTQALDLFTRKDSMIREIDDENAYSNIVNKLASMLVDLSNDIVSADIKKEKSKRDPKKKIKVCGDLKKTCKCKNKDRCQAVQFQQCFTED